MTTGTELMHQAAPTRGEAFRKELADLLNRYSIENGSNTPDFLLADYVIESLRALNEAVNAREKWYGRERDSPSTAAEGGNK